MTAFSYIRGFLPISIKETLGLLQDRKERKQKKKPKKICGWTRLGMDVVVNIVSVTMWRNCISAILNVEYS
jgi:hypothetical protein